MYVSLPVSMYVCQFVHTSSACFLYAQVVCPYWPVNIAPTCICVNSPLQSAFFDKMSRTFLFSFKLLPLGSTNFLRVTLTSTLTSNFCPNGTLCDPNMDVLHKPHQYACSSLYSCSVGSRQFDSFSRTR